MDILFRNAKKDDLKELVHMLYDDKLGKHREDVSLELNEKYIEAFKAIDNDSNNELIVLELNNKIIGMLQLTYIPSLSDIGSWRCLIEGVRIHNDYRGKGYGTIAIQWAINRAKEKNCNFAQLTSNKQRSNAIKFYKSLGFINSHEGMKLNLND